MVLPAVAAIAVLPSAPMLLLADPELLAYSEREDDHNRDDPGRPRTAERTRARPPTLRILSLALVASSAPLPSSSSFLNLKFY